MVPHHRRAAGAGLAARSWSSTASAPWPPVIVLLDRRRSRSSPIGAWVPVVVIPLIIACFWASSGTTTGSARALAVTPERLPAAAVTPHRRRARRARPPGVLEALAYARSLRARPPRRRVRVVRRRGAASAIEQQWEELRHRRAAARSCTRPYRELTGRCCDYLDELDDRWQNDIITVVIPEFVVNRWWEQILHNQSALILKGKLLFRDGVVVTSVPYHVDAAADARRSGCSRSG